MNEPRQRIAVIGAGVSGLTAAWLLSEHHDVQLFEAGDYAGGHTNTEHVQAGGKEWPVNTGFIVFNDWTYPNFIRLMDRLGVASEVSDMSFSVDCHANGLQYNGTSLNTLFAQRSNLLNLPFLKMVREILRFNQESRADLASGAINDEETLGEYLNRNRYSRYFRNYYIVPMGAAIWSAPEIVLERFPIRFFLQFFNNHGMLSVDDRPTWRVISGGSAQYVNKMMDRLGDRPEQSGDLRHAVAGQGSAHRPGSGTRIRPGDLRLPQRSGAGHAIRPDRCGTQCPGSDCLPAK